MQFYARVIIPGRECVTEFYAISMTVLRSKVHAYVSQEKQSRYMQGLDSRKYVVNYFVNAENEVL